MESGINFNKEKTLCKEQRPLGWRYKPGHKKLLLCVRGYTIVACLLTNYNLNTGTLAYIKGKKILLVRTPVEDECVRTPAKVPFIHTKGAPLTL